MIWLIVDTKPGERNLLTSNETKPLIIRDQYKAIFKEIQAPPGGWTVSRLMEAIRPIKIRPADAYLGEQWIGSTEA